MSQQSKHKTEKDVKFDFLHLFVLKHLTKRRMYYDQNRPLIEMLSFILFNCYLCYKDGNIIFLDMNNSTQLKHSNVLQTDDGELMPGWLHFK